MGVAEELLSLTRVVTNAGDLEPGDLLTVDVIPGSPLAGADLLGASQLLPLRVSFKVEKHVPHQMGGGWRVEDWTSQTARIPPGPGDELGDLLHVAFLLAPPLDFGSNLPPAEYVVTVTLEVKNTGVSRAIRIPVKVPPIRIPPLAIFSSGPRFEPFTDDEPNAILVQTGALDVSGLDRLLETYNTVLSTLGTIADAIGFLSFVLAPLRLVAEIVGKVPFPPNVAIGQADDWTELPADTPRFPGNGFDDENASLLLIGPTDLGMRVFDTTEGTSFWGELEAKVYPVDLKNVIAQNTELARYVREELVRALQRFELPAELPDVPAPPHPLGFGLMVIGDWHPDTFDAFPDARKDALRRMFFYEGDTEVYRNVESSFWTS